jgi:hypothetical protein
MLFFGWLARRSDPEPTGFAVSGSTSIHVMIMACHSFWLTQYTPLTRQDPRGRPVCPRVRARLCARRSGRRYRGRDRVRAVGCRLIHMFGWSAHSLCETTNCVFFFCLFVCLFVCFFAPLQEPRADAAAPAAAAVAAPDAAACARVPAAAAAAAGGLSAGLGAGAGPLGARRGTLRDAGYSVRGREAPSPAQRMPQSSRGVACIPAPMPLTTSCTETDTVSLSLFPAIVIATATLQR